MLSGFSYTSIVNLSSYLALRQPNEADRYHKNC